MLEGRKPFAFFVQEYPPHRHSTEAFFDPHVANGLLYKHVDAEAFAEPIRGIDGRVFEGVRTVCYARQGEEWRVPAWKLIREAAQKSRWNENFERLEGMLLGYEDWQNDWYIARYRQDARRWGVKLARFLGRSFRAKQQLIDAFAPRFSPPR
jgi:hypothetical protein